MKIVLAYLIPIDEWQSYGPSARKFAERYGRFAPEIDHELLVMCCNGPDKLSATNDSDENGRITKHSAGSGSVTDDHGGNDHDKNEVFAGVPARFESYHGTGWDCGAAQYAAQIVDCDFLVCANAGVYFWRAGWLRRLAEARAEHGEGLYGASASYETLPFVPGEINPHIRTSFYGCDPKTFRQFPFRIDSREKCFQFESGEWNFTRWFMDRGQTCQMVTWDGCYQSQDFRTPPNIFRRGDQSNLIVRDRHMDMYELADRKRRGELEKFADGGLPRDLSGTREVSAHGKVC